MSFNLFDWIREGVKRSVIQGVAEALEVVGSPAGDDGPAKLAHFIPLTEGSSSAMPGASKRKRLGRSLRDVDGGE
jgi:hypothetical protein